VHKLVISGLFGPEKRIISTKELMDKKHISDLQIKCLILKYPEEQCKKVKGISYQDEIEFLIQNETRNKYIRNLTLGLEGNTLLLYNYVDKHGKIIHDLLAEKIQEGRKLFFICGKTDVEDREEFRRIVETENNAIIVGSYGCMSTGINIKNLHNLIFASPTKSKIRTLQSIGRALRLGDNKNGAVLYDIADDLRYSVYTNYSLKHYEERINIYNGEKFNYKSYNVVL
jgi:superfamily II DNA or RNA helicase